MSIEKPKTRQTKLTEFGIEIKEKIMVPQEEIEGIEKMFQGSYIILREIGIIKTLDQFKKLIQDERMISLFVIVKEYKLEHVLRSCQIETLDQLKELAQNKKVMALLMDALNFNLELVLRSCQIKTFNQLKELARDGMRVRMLLRNVGEYKLEHVLRSCQIKTFNQLKELACGRNVIDFLTRVRIYNLKYFFDLYQIKNLKQFEKFLMEKELLEFLCSDEDLGKIDSVIRNIEEGDFNEEYIKEKIKFLRFHPDSFKIRESILDNLRKSKGDYRMNTFPKDVLKYLSSCLTISYLSLKEPKGKVLKEVEKIKDKKPELYKKIIIHKNLRLDDLFYGKRAIELLDRPENLNYFSIAQKFNYFFDKFGIIGKDLEQIKRDVDQKVKEIIDNYEEKKKEYIPHLISILGYDSKDKKWTNELLEIENLWEFKTSHLEEDLRLALDEIKDLKTEIKPREIKKERKTYLKNLKEHLEKESFLNAGERIKNLEPKNREKGEKLIKKTEEIIKILEKEEMPNSKDISFLLTNKNIFTYLGLSLTYDSLKTLLQFSETPKEKVFSSFTIEILKKPEEHLGAMDIEPSCMRVEGKYPLYALTVVQAPIFIIGFKDNELGKIRGRALLLPVKDEKGKWVFELKRTYGIGDKEIVYFAQKIEQTLKEKRKDYYEKRGEIVSKKIISGMLPKTKETPFSKTPIFWRDGKGSQFLEIYINSQ